MVVSMTGFGRSVKSIEDAKVTVEMKSVNHRYSDCYVRMPRQLLKMEDKLKKIIHKRIKRGKIDVFVNVEGNVLVHRKVKVDWQLLDQYGQSVMEIKEKLNISSSLELRDILSKEEIVVIEEVEEENVMIEQLVLEATKEATENLFSMREFEGAALQKELKGYLNSMKEILLSVTEYGPTVADQYKEKLASKLSNYTSGLIDENRLLTEIVIMAEKVDISEEVSRLENHIQQFSVTLEKNEPIGRKLDFLLQEMNREVNTTGAKCNDVTLSTLVVDLKAIIEKMREQVQNIE
ncbi:YicC/YloC family endoribonuclease [Bacillus spongiae]|uniref:YicC/YloC family endoribonuclease n=1 Tax=Bacillus spongiae TaxID=2683610 RepID=A0ABU8HA64_9BACI